MLRMTTRCLDQVTGEWCFFSQGVEPKRKNRSGEGKGRSSGVNTLSMRYLWDSQVETSSGPLAIWI